MFELECNSTIQNYLLSFGGRSNLPIIISNNPVEPMIICKLFTVLKRNICITIQPLNNTPSAMTNIL